LFQTAHELSTRGLHVQAMPSATIRFLSDERGALSGVEIKSTGRLALLLELGRALYALRVGVLGAESVDRGALRYERLLLEDSTGAALHGDRRAAVQAELLQVVQRALSAALALPSLEDEPSAARTRLNWELGKGYSPASSTA
jgi:UTP:GlnB (protein PII) uridylyltransferase